MAEKRPVCVVEKHVLYSTSETGVSCTVSIKQIMCVKSTANLVFQQTACFSLYIKQYNN
jgi:hypothetical protein